jgi:lipopolysaccharide export system permease protein
MALFVLVSINLVFVLNSEMNQIGKGDYDFFRALIYTLSTAPRRMHEYIPMACIIGTLLYVGALASDMELVAIQSAGISKKRIVVSALKGGIYLVALSFILSELVIPFSEPYARQLRALSINKSAAIKGVGGIWVREGNTFINIKKLLPDAGLSDLTILEFSDDMDLKVLSHAREAHYHKPKWVLNNVDTAKISLDGISISRIKVAEWKVLMNPEIINVLAADPEHQSLVTLSTYIQYMESNSLNVTPYLFAFWDRLAKPFAIFGMIIIAFPLLFGNMRTTSMGSRATIGIVIGIAYLLISRLFLNFGAAYNFGPVISNMMPLATLFLFGLLHLKISESH